MAMRLGARRGAGHEDLQRALREEVHRAVRVALLDQQVAGPDVVAREIGRDAAPLVERQARTECVFRVERLDRLNQV
jgi:hypothetical protein